MLKGTILDKYWNKEELKGLSLKRALAIIQQMEMWEGKDVSKKMILLKLHLKMLSDLKLSGY